MIDMKENQVVDGDVIDLRACLMWVDSENITYQEFKPGVDVSLEDAKEMARVRKRLLRSKRGPRLTDIRGVKSTPKAVRDFGQSKEVAQMTTAFAIIVDSPMTRTLGTIFMQLTRPPYPTRMFTNKDDALKWLRGYLE